MNKILVWSLVSSFAFCAFGCSSSSGGASGGSGAKGDAGDGGNVPLCCILTDGVGGPETSMPYPESQCDATDDPNTGAPPDGKWACVDDSAGVTYTCKCVLNQMCVTAVTGTDAGTIVTGLIKPCN